MKKLLKILRNIFVGLLLLILVAVAGLYISAPVVTQRLASAATGGDQGPKEVVPGGPLIEFESASHSTIDQRALDDAIEFGATNNSHALIVWQDDGIVLEHYYPGFDASTLSPTQSMHKSIVALLLGVAIEQGHIGSVDDPAARYLPEWANDDRSKITLRQMLRQTSGLNFNSVGLTTALGFLKMMLGPDVTETTLTLEQEVEPGSRFDYNTAIPQNVGLIIQRATGQRYAEYLSSALWQHLGVNDAYVLLDSEEKGMARTGCCLDATARGWLRIGLLHLNQGRIGDTQVVPADWMREVIEPGVHNSNYGYFTWLGTTWEERRRYNRKSPTTVYHSEPFAAPDVIYFDGFGGQRVYIVPSKKLVIVRTGAIVPDWDDAYLPNLIIRGTRD